MAIAVVTFEIHGWKFTLIHWATDAIACTQVTLVDGKDLVGVYMRKLAPARVSYWDDLFISYRVYIMTRSLHILLSEGTLLVDKIQVRFKIANMCMHYPFQSTRRLISHWNLWSFRVYMILLRDLVPQWNSRPGTTTGVNSRQGDSCWHDMVSCNQM